MSAFRPASLVTLLLLWFPAPGLASVATTRADDTPATAPAALQVRVTAPPGRPVSTATMLAVRVGDKSPGLSLPALDGGRYAQQDLEPGLWVITVQHEGHAVVSRELRLDAEAQREVERRSEGRLASLGTGLGVVWQTARFGGNGAMTAAAPDPLLLPDFTRVDASLTYRRSGQTDLGVHCENLTDQGIFVSGTVGSSLEIAAPRTLMFRIGYRM